MQDETFTQSLRNLLICIEHGPKEAAVGAAEFLVQLAQQPQRQNWFAARFAAASA